MAREASIRGKWVIAADAGGLAEDIVDGATGRILPFPPTKSSLLSALKELASMPAPPNFSGEAITTFPDQARELTPWLRELTEKKKPLHDQPFKDILQAP